MTITTSQLDDLERFARSEQRAGWPKCAVDFDVTLQLVAIARAALAMIEADHALNRASSDSRMLLSIRATEAYDKLRAALRGAP